MGTVKLIKAIIKTMTSSSVSSSKDSSMAGIFLKISGVVALYWVVSISMVFMNREVLSGSSYSIQAPLFVTWFQCLITIAITAVYLKARYSRIEFHFDTMLRVTSLTLVFVAMITFNNLCLQNMGVAFYFVGRSLTTVFNVIFTYLKFGRKTSVPAIACCFGIVVGFSLGIDQENVVGTLSIKGVIYGVLASLFVSLNSIYTEQALNVLQGDVWALQLYHNIIASLVFIPMILLFGEVQTLSNSTVLSEPLFWGMLSLSGIFACGIGFVTSLQIKYTSPLTHTISGTAKAAVQTVIATTVYHESKTFTWWLSNVIVLFSSAAYARVRQLEMLKNKSNTVTVKASKYRRLDEHDSDEETIIKKPSHKLPI